MLTADKTAVHNSKKVQHIINNSPWYHCHLTERRFTDSSYYVSFTKFFSLLQSKETWKRQRTHSLDSLQKNGSHSCLSHRGHHRFDHALKLGQVKKTDLTWLQCTGCWEFTHCNFKLPRQNPHMHRENTHTCVAVQWLVLYYRWLTLFFPVKNLIQLISLHIFPLVVHTYRRGACLTVW